jgi:hypothetical protein
VFLCPRLPYCVIQAGLGVVSGKKRPAAGGNRLPQSSLARRTETQLIGAETRPHQPII